MLAGKFPLANQAKLVVIPQLGQGNPVRNANWHWSSPNWVCVPIPVGLGTSRAAMSINERQAAQIVSHRIRPHAPTLTDSIRGENIGGTCEEFIAAKYRVEVLITMVSAQRLGSERSEAAANFQPRFLRKRGQFLSYAILMNHVTQGCNHRVDGCSLPDLAAVSYLQFGSLGMLPPVRNTS
jgi:hypothetical protein